MQSRVMLWQMRLGAAVLLLWTMAARAEPIPSEYLEVERQSCNQSCTGAGSPAAWCMRYCDCSIGRMKAEIPFAQYSQVGAAAVADAPQPPGMTDRLAAIAAACAKQTQ